MKAIPDDLYLLAFEVWADESHIKLWFSHPNMFLDGLTPNEMLRQKPDGIERVRNLLGQIKYGVYS